MNRPKPVAQRLSMPVTLRSYFNNDSLLSFCFFSRGALNWGFLACLTEKSKHFKELVIPSRFVTLFFQNGKGYVNVDLTCGKVKI
ncbi:hypothetical protein TU99_03915 [Lactobacillus helveticus]|nr:hypothetical protein TU99_03915 [Lactobacillus helveticus]